MPRNYVTPRVFSAEITLTNGKVVSKQLGVAFNNVHRQERITRFNTYKHWEGYGLVQNVKLVVEKLNETSGQTWKTSREDATKKSRRSVKTT